MKRTQLYLEDDLWSALHILARRESTTLSELVRQAVRARYLGDFEERRKAMQALVAVRATSKDDENNVRELRRGSRLERLDQE
jgi:predicted transcriptional regulator